MPRPHLSPHFAADIARYPQVYQWVVYYTIWFRQDGEKRYIHSPRATYAHLCQSLADARRDQARARTRRHSRAYAEHTARVEMLDRVLEAFGPLMARHPTMPLAEACGDPLPDEQRPVLVGRPGGFALALVGVRLIRIGAEEACQVGVDETGNVELANQRRRTVDGPHPCHFHVILIFKIRITYLIVSIELPVIIPHRQQVILPCIHNPWLRQCESAEFLIVRIMRAIGRGDAEVARVTRRERSPTDGHRPTGIS
jgi:hypothetical protein